MKKKDEEKGRLKPKFKDTKQIARMGTFFQLKNDVGWFQTQN